MDRIFITGNGGSGKSWLAQRLGDRLRRPAFHLDEFHWLPNFRGERPREERDKLVAEAAGGDDWVMEGIYGRILRQVLPRVTTLIWIDLPDHECIANLRQRGPDGTQEQFDELLQYTLGYRLRKNHLNSFDAHAQFFQDFPGHKVNLCSRSDVVTFLAAV
jgi:adenylate kinase family enzyme